MSEAEGQAYRLIQCLLDSMNAQIVLLDTSGAIVMMNTPHWCRPETGHPLSALRLAVGSNYVAACEAATRLGRNAGGQCSWDIGELAAAVRAVLAGDPNRYSGEHRCLDRGVDRWFRVTVSPVPVWRTARALVSHQEITADKRRDAENRDRAVMMSKISALSAREREILDRVVDGKSNKMIAYDLKLSHKTVEKHRANVMKKLQARNVAELVRQIVAARCATADEPIETARSL